MQEITTVETTTTTPAAAMSVDEAAGGEGPKERNTTRVPDPRPKKRRSRTFESSPVPVTDSLRNVTTSFSLFDGDEEEEGDSSGLFETSGSTGETESQSNYISPATFVAAGMWDPVDQDHNQRLMRILATLEGCNNTFVQELISYLGRAGTYNNFGTCDRDVAHQKSGLGIDELIQLLKGARTKKEVMITPYRLLEFLFRTQSAKMSVAKSPFDIRCGKISFAEVLGREFSECPDPRRGKWSPRSLKALSDALSLELKVNFRILSVPLDEYRALSTILTILKASVRNGSLEIKRAPTTNRRIFIKPGDNMLMDPAALHACENVLLAASGNPVSNPLFAGYDLVGYLWKHTRVASKLPSPLPIPACIALTSLEKDRLVIAKDMTRKAKSCLVSQSKNRAARRRLMKYIPEMDHYMFTGFLSSSRRKKEFVNLFCCDAAVASYQLDVPKAPTTSTGRTLFYDPGWGHTLKASTISRLDADLGNRDFNTICIYLPIVPDFKEYSAFLNKIWAYAVARKYTALSMFNPEQAHSPYYVMCLSRTEQVLREGRDCIGKWISLGRTAREFTQRCVLGQAAAIERVMKAEINYMSWCSAGVPYPWLEFQFVNISPLLAPGQEEIRAEEQLFSDY